jgi:mannose-6-phosphate isomerase-like protein (cupin superfamily)
MSTPEYPLVVVQRDAVPAFITKDSSEIREILAPRNAPLAIQKQSLAEATIAPGAATEAHYHPNTEEIYYILQGTGQMQISTTMQTVVSGDGIAIPAGAPHQIRNIGSETLVFLCCCVPAYSDDDTIMVSLPEPQTVLKRI